MSGIVTDLPRSAGSVRTARELVRAHAAGLRPQQREDAALMVSELVTNALQHGIGTISLRIDSGPAGLRVEVSDGGNVAVSPTPSPGAHGGWGLRIVEEVADEWGVLEGSTRVWFRLGLEPAG
jgi:anti-sigma regulatory factor (Ser/Thr protein kinase)